MFYSMSFMGKPDCPSMYSPTHDEPFEDQGYPTVVVEADDLAGAAAAAKAWFLNDWETNMLPRIQQDETAGILAFSPEWCDSITVMARPDLNADGTYNFECSDQEAQHVSFGTFDFETLESRGDTSAFGALFGRPIGIGSFGGA